METRACLAWSSRDKEGGGLARRESSQRLPAAEERNRWGSRAVERRSTKLAASTLVTADENLTRATRGLRVKEIARRRDARGGGCRETEEGVACRPVFTWIFLSCSSAFFLSWLSLSLSLSLEPFFLSLQVPCSRARAIPPSRSLFSLPFSPAPLVARRRCATRGRAARRIFMSRNAANWPKINAHVEKYYPLSLCLSFVDANRSITIALPSCRS